MAQAPESWSACRRLDCCIAHLGQGLSGVRGAQESERKAREAILGMHPRIAARNVIGVGRLIWRM